MAYRCNFVTIADGFMKDNTAGHIATEQADILVGALNEAFAGTPFEFHTGVSYRNLMVWRGGELVPCTPPHDILDQPVAGHLPPGRPGPLCGRSCRPRTKCSGRCGRERTRGCGARARRRSAVLQGLRGLRGAVVGAVDLVRGLGVYAGMDVLDVPGATGDLDTDYAAKGRAAAAALTVYEFVLVHVERPTRRGNGSRGREGERHRARRCRGAGTFWQAPERPAVMVLPDHHTPVRLRTHTAPPVPFVYAASSPLAGAGDGRVR